MKKLTRLSVIFILSLGCIGCDQSTKFLAKSILQFESPKSYLNNTLIIAYHENSGAFLGLGNSLPSALQTVLFQIFVAIILFSLLIFLLTTKKLDTLSMSALTLFFAGGLSNLIDRLTNDGAVVDFLNVGIGPVRTGVFNVADIAIVLGAGLLWFGLYRNDQKKSEGTSVKT